MIKLIMAYHMVKVTIQETVKKKKAESERFLLNIWSQIELAFNNGYDNHLIFEALNEPRLRGDSHE